MTSPSDHPPPPDPNPAPEPVGRSGSIVLVLLVAGAIVAAAVAFMLLGKTQAQPYILGLLAVLVRAADASTLAASISRAPAPARYQLPATVS